MYDYAACWDEEYWTDSSRWAAERDQEIAMTDADWDDVYHEAFFEGMGGD